MPPSIITICLLKGKPTKANEHRGKKSLSKDVTQVGTNSELTACVKVINNIYPQGQKKI